MGGGVTQKVRQTDTYRDRGIVTDKERKRERAKETDRQTRQGCVTGRRKRNRRLKKNRKKRESSRTVSQVRKGRLISPTGH